MGILIYSDDLDVTRELVTLASKLGKDASVAVLGQQNISDLTRKASVSGVTTVFEVSNDNLKGLLVGPVVDALEAVYSQAKPDMVLIGATKRGKEVAPRLATRLKIGCISDALKVELNGSNAIVDRLVWGGNSIATVVSKGVAIVTVPPRAHERAASSSSPNVVKVEFQPKPNKIVLLGKREKSAGQVSLKDAEIIVSAGRGFKKKEDLAILDDLTKLLNGAMGVSRPLASDLGWVPEERQVGLSGTTVKPKLYIAVGISGQIQHLTGMRDSKLVVAINTDKNAPIFQECDYGVVGDLYLTIPELVKALKSQLGR
ncbi:MAG: electron transfer flavoprotein subunit alpha/FixB family protein [Nitrososphaerales archaeon]